MTVVAVQTLQAGLPTARSEPGSASRPAFLFVCAASTTAVSSRKPHNMSEKASTDASDLSSNPYRVRAVSRPQTVP